MFYRQNREPIIYVRIWKCANVGITNNLMHVISDPQTPLEEVLLHEAKTVGILNIEYLLGPYIVNVSTLNSLITTIYITAL